jgi:hypothetical protein
MHTKPTLQSYRRNSSSIVLQVADLVKTLATGMPASKVLISLQSHSSTSHMAFRISDAMLCYYNANKNSNKPIKISSTEFAPQLMLGC